MVDIQPENMAGRAGEEFINTCNNVIATYAPENVIYIMNLRPLAPKPSSNPFTKGLQIVSDSIFTKRLPDAFSNHALKEKLMAMGADEVEVIGIDGNWCIKATALGAVKNGFRAKVNVRAVASKNKLAFEGRTLKKLVQARVEVIVV